MGKSTTSCFKIISCGGGDESVDRDEINVSSSENKGHDKRGWSFRKRSARHRVLSNTVVSENPSSDHKQSSITEIPSSDHKESSITEIPSSDHKESSITEIPPSSDHKESSITEIPSSDHKESSITEIPPSSEKSSITEIPPSSDHKESSITEIPSSDHKERSITEIPSSDHKESSISEIPPSSDHKEGSVTEIPSSEKSSITEIPSSDDKESTVTEIPSPDHKESSITEIPISENEECSITEQSLSSDHKESAITEIPSLENKETSEFVTIKSTDKSSDDQLTEELVSTITSEAACVDDNKSESAILVIQAAVRRFLAEKEMVKHKNVVKLQAAVRGHLVRNHAVGTLRCVQAIVKMQTLVRARNAQKSSLGEKGINSNPTNISVEKLLSNKLARQLLESTPKTKQINIKCDPSKSDSAWSWLERWMSVFSPETIDPDTVKTTENQVEATAESTNTDSNGEQNSSVTNHEEEKTQPQEPVNLNTEDEIEVGSISEKPVSTKSLATEQSDSEGRKPVFVGLRKASNPAFIAAQSRFEELTSKTNPLKSVACLNQDNEPADTSSPVLENTTPITTDVEPEEHPVSHGSRVVPSECGTELSVTSTLDSPDQSEPENKKPLMPEKQDDDSELEKLKPAENVVDNAPSDADIELEPESGNQICKSSEKVEAETETVHQAYKSTSEASPRSHITVPESQGTPSSQISTNSKKTKSEKKGDEKRKSWSSSKKSGVISSVKIGVGKRRNSFGSPRPDEEGRGDVPSYMQATESAKAKAIANSSPKSSPDVHDKELLLKKRHSLPGVVNGRQGSPRIQRSMSQAVQTTKGNVNQERKWQR